MNSRAFVFFGRSGCGKGTQAELLADYLNKKGEKVLHIETGKAFRRLAEGDGRRREEAVALGSAFDFYKIKNPSIILMNVSKKWSSDKMLGRRRTDDTPEKIENRLNWYEKDVMPSIDYFREGPGYNFVEINGEQTIEKVHEDIIKALGY